MKTRIVLILFLTASIALLYLGCASSYSSEKETDLVIDTLTENENTLEPVSLETFQDSLSNYGQFIRIDSSEIDPDNALFDDGTEMENLNNEDNSNVDESSNVDADLYTNYIWVPDANKLYEGWNPYTDGRWFWTGWGWTWVSNYSWGWGPYHYGRWWYSNVYGWVWSPGRVWGPSWVNWCNNGEYVGWYPTSPRNHWRDHRRIRVNHHYRHNGWVVVRKKEMTDPLSRKNEVTGTVREDLIKKVKPFDNTVNEGKKIVNKGPEVKDIEKSKGSKIEQKNLTEVIKFPVKKENNNVSKKENNNVTKDDNTKNIINDVKNGNATKEGNNGTVDQNKKNNGSKSKTNVNSVTNYNTTKTYNSTETYNKTNTGSKESTNKTETKKETVKSNKTENTNKTGNTYKPESSNKTGTSNKTVTSSPKVTSPPVKQAPPQVKVTQPPVKQSPPPVQKESPKVKDNGKK
jgi:hypothetical protein